MPAKIRDYIPSDEEAVVKLSLRDWAPVFASMETVVGHDIFIGLHGDWQRYQTRSVRETLVNNAMRVWVAAAQERVLAFVAATLDSDRLVGEIWMLAVDPDDQSHGVGTALTEFATDWLRESGMRVATVATGGDSGHAPARRVYEKANYTPSPGVRYFKAL
jgi:GNAT superfamily N-acetyltransferase